MVHLLTCTVQDGVTALITAAQNGHERAVEILIAAKAQVNIKNKVRFTTIYNYLDVYTGRLDGIVHGQ